jgi:hypothetical protein
MALDMKHDEREKLELYQGVEKHVKNTQTQKKQYVMRVIYLL